MADPHSELPPISESFTPIPPVVDGVPRSDMYSVVKLGNDYDLFMGRQEGYDPNKPIEQKQRDLFGLYERGVVRDTIQAWEWMLSRKWNEWDSVDKRDVWGHLKPVERDNLGPVKRIFTTSK